MDITYNCSPPLSVTALSHHSQIQLRQKKNENCLITRLAFNLVRLLKTFCCLLSFASLIWVVANKSLTTVDSSNNILGLNLSPIHYSLFVVVATTVHYSLLPLAHWHLISSKAFSKHLQFTRCHSSSQDANLRGVESIERKIRRKRK